MTRPVTPEEFDALTRIVASRIFDDPQESIDEVDTVSHRLAQISYLPSISGNQDYSYAVAEGEVLNPDVVMAWFEGDWRDVTQLPRRSDEKAVRATDQNRKMGGPERKAGRHRCLLPGL